MLKKIDLNNLPHHIGVIVDGNGRWAKKRGLPRNLGHKAGILAIKEFVKNAKEIGINCLTFYCFSTENWKRPKQEIDAIFEYAYDFFTNQQIDYGKENIKLMTMGDLSKLPEKLQTVLNKIKNETQNNNGIIVNLAINYGAHAEILKAVNDCLKLRKDEITKQDFEKCLQSNGLPALDLVIRTSGEQRLSNFMLYQVAYAELYFPKIHWPSFNKKSFYKAIFEYQKRNRRFGNI